MGAARFFKPLIMTSSLTITGVDIFHLQFPPNHFVQREAWARQTVVRVRTSDPEVFGLGCATFTYRYRAVESTIREHLTPLIIGHDPRNSTELFQLMRYSGYWRNGPILNNAISGIDMALWDIKGKLAGLPCYQLWGGKTRVAALAYQHVNGDNTDEVLENARRLVGQGLKVIRCQLGHYSGPIDQIPQRLEGAPANGTCYLPEQRLAQIPQMFAALRREFGEELGILYDIHERLDPMDSLRLAKELEPYHPYFLEDPLAPEQMDWLRTFRAQTATKIAIGELFTHPLEIVPYAKESLFDYLRVHLSMMGGITPMLQLAHLCESFGIRTAWHGPPDLSLVGGAAMVHLDVALPNFGVQEWAARVPEEYEVFRGAPSLKEGYLYPSDGPGLGIVFDETLAQQFPPEGKDSEWLVMRRPDGSLTPP